MLFKFICNEVNNFIWLMKINEDIEIHKIEEKVPSNVESEISNEPVLQEQQQQQQE